MGKCVVCGEETTNLVNDKIGKNSFLCKECINEFGQCSLCGEYFYKDELDGGLCEYCRERLDGED